MREPLAKHSQNEPRGARQQCGVGIKNFRDQRPSPLVETGGGAQAPSKMNEQLYAHLDGQKRRIEESFRAVVWLSSEVKLPRHALKRVGAGAEGNKSDVANPRQKS